MLSKRKSEAEASNPKKKRRSGGLRGPHFDWNQSTWGKMLLDPKIQIVSTREGRLFRRRFRIPFPLFRRLVTMCRERDLFPFKGRVLESGEMVDRAGRPVIPLELKILGVLRILGDSSGISEAAMCEFFHLFCERFVQEYYHDFVKRPEGDNLRSVMEMYEKLGFPGCVGSIDCTHIRWDKCPVSLTNLCKGKGQHPTLVFEATVDHNKRVLGMTRSFYGTINDKTIVKSDSYVQDVKDGICYGEVKYKITMANGGVVEKTGVYFLCDGGYH